MVTPGRSFSVGTQYRYGFNGKENDKDMNAGAVAFEARIYDSRLGRFSSTDPMFSKYPWQTPYAYNKNSPISHIDWLGLGDKYFGEKGNFLYESKGNGTGLYVVNTAQFMSLNSASKGNDENLSQALSKVGIKAFGSQDEAAKDWAKSGYSATKNDPEHLERAAQIFHVQTFGKADISDLFVVGSTVTGNKSNVKGVVQEVNPLESEAPALNGHIITETVYKYFEPVTRKARYDELKGWQHFPSLFGSYPTITVLEEQTYQFWNASAVIHSHPPDGDNNRFSGNSGDMGFAIDGFSVYLVPTPQPRLTYILRIDPEDVEYGVPLYEEAQKKFGQEKQKTIWIK